MAKKSGPVDPLKAKEAKQKKIAAVGGVILLIVLAIQVPKLMKQLGGSSAAPPAPATTTSASTPPTSTFSSAPGTATGAAAATGGSGGSGGVTVAAGAPTASVGQLTSFGSFVGKDPFASQAPSPGSSTAKPGGGTTGTGTTAKPPAPPTPPTPPAVVVTPTSAVISVNGVEEQVNVGADFPSAQPYFHLVSLTAHTAKISIAGGSLASGNATVTVKEGKPVTLMNTTDQRRYTIKLFPQGTTVPTSTTTAATTAPPATSTTTSATGGTSTTSGG